MSEIKQITKELSQRLKERKELMDERQAKILKIGVIVIAGLYASKYVFKFMAGSALALQEFVAALKNKRIK